MEQEPQLEPRFDPVRSSTLRDIVAPVFRHARGGFVVAGVVLLVTLIAVVVIPRKYQAEMTLLVKRERTETIVSPDPGAATQRPAEVTEDELNSEVEILKSRDLLQQVVAATGLASKTDRLTAARAERTLASALDVTPIRKTTLIKVSYSSTDPAQAARVLDAVGRLYLQKHLAIHRPIGAYEFFSQQTLKYRDELGQAEQKLKEYGRQQGVVAGDVERETTLRQFGEFTSQFQQTQAQIADATRRLQELDSIAERTPDRLVTQIRTADNATLIAALRTKVLDLQLRRTELLQKYQASYPAVVQVEAQLADASAALESNQRAPATDQSTDSNPTYAWVQNERARVTAERGAALARSAAIAKSVALFQSRARELDEKSVVQQELRRTIKTAEENYLLYQKKQEEARISDALDRTRIANVVIAEPPTVPELPSSTGRLLMLLVGCMAAFVLGIVTTYVLHYLSPFFHTPDDIEDSLDVPVLATFPAAGR